MSSEGAKKRVPEFRTLEEAASFWDTHDASDFEDEWETVEMEVAHPLHHIVAVRLESEAFRQLSAIARAQGIGASTLVRTWVLDAIEAAGHQNQASSG